MLSNLADAEISLPDTLCRVKTPIYSTRMKNLTYCFPQQKTKIINKEGETKIQ